MRLTLGQLKNLVLEVSMGQVTQSELDTTQEQIHQRLEEFMMVESDRVAETLSGRPVTVRHHTRESGEQEITGKIAKVEITETEYEGYLIGFQVDEVPGRTFFFEDIVG